MITSKGVSLKGGRTIYRGLVWVGKGSEEAKSAVRCDSLMVDEKSTSVTYPYEFVYEENASVVHEATAGRIGKQQLFYLQSRGLKEEQAQSLIVSGYLADFAKDIPPDFAIELYRLIELELTGAVG
jgi:Fe-S cluster assembly protein SufB